MTTARLRLVEWAERGMPVLTRAIATPAVRGARTRATDQGQEYSSDAAASSLVVYFTGLPETARWLAGSLAVRLATEVLVADTRAGRGADPAPLLAAAIADRGLDASRVAVVGEGDASTAAVTACAGIRVARLALLYPAIAEVEAPESMPTTLIQAARYGPDRAAVLALDALLRRSGVAVRETEYESVPDGWARHPKLVPGSSRALGDLVAFLERGFGVPSTFEVIPGWDLH